MVKKSRRGKKERRLEKELLGILAFMAFLVIVFLISSSIFRSFNSFEYEGLTFTKERVGEIPVYHYYYYFKDGGRIIKYNLYLRNDPRTIEVPVEGDKILFDRKGKLYLSINSTGLDQCRYSVLAIADLSRFLTENGINVEGSNLDFWKAWAIRQEWATCENKPDNSVIEIREGSETKISIDDGCYTISVANCEILEATEKFKVQSILDAK